MLELVDKACGEQFQTIFQEAFAPASRLQIPKTPLSIAIPDSRALITKVGQKFLSEQSREFQWLPEYDKIAAWLANNEQKGLLLSGAPGRGKTLISQLILPVIFKIRAQSRGKKLWMQSFRARELEPSKICPLSNPQFFIGIDDLGLEPLTDEYRRPLCLLDQIVERAIDHGLLLLITTNLSKSQLEARYGTATLDRLLSVTRLIACPGESLRSK